MVVLHNAGKPEFGASQCRQQMLWLEWARGYRIRKTEECLPGNSKVSCAAHESYGWQHGSFLQAHVHFLFVCCC